MSRSAVSYGAPLARALRLALPAGLIWWILTDARDWLFGAVAITVAVATALRVGGFKQGRRPSPWGLLRFALYFLSESVASGLDVARRAFSPRLPLDMTWLDYDLRLPPGPSRLLFVNTVSLLPGTLSADLQDNRVTIHSLAGTHPAELERLERRVAELFRINLGTIHGDRTDGGRAQ